MEVASGFGGRGSIPSTNYIHIMSQLVEHCGPRPMSAWVRVPDVKQAGLAQVVIVTNTGFSPVDVDRAHGF
jgi:hypothetical protein